MNLVNKAAPRPQRFDVHRLKRSSNAVKSKEKESVIPIFLLSFVSTRYIVQQEKCEAKEAENREVVRAEVVGDCCCRNFNIGKKNGVIF